MLRELGLFNLKRIMWGNLLAAFHYLKGASKKRGGQAFQQGLLWQDNEQWF